jgi:hypothetical protein
MSRKAARSSSPRRLLRRRRLSTTSLPNPTERRSPASSPRCSFSRLGFFLAFCWSALLASRPSASRLFLRYRIPHALHSDCDRSERVSQKRAQIGGWERG